MRDLSSGSLFLLLVITNRFYLFIILLLFDVNIIIQTLHPIISEEGWKIILLHI